MDKREKSSVKYFYRLLKKAEDGEVLEESLAIMTQKLTNLVVPYYTVVLYIHNVEGNSVLKEELTIGTSSFYNLFILGSRVVDEASAIDMLRRWSL